LSSIKKNLMLLVIFAVLPALAILLYSGEEQRQASIENAKNNVSLLANVMAESQRNMALVTRKMLSTLSLLPQIQALDIQATNQIFKAVIENNPGYHNIVLIDIDGKIIASNRPFDQVYLGDRKHFREAVESKDFAAGEYILTRVGQPSPVFPFAYPVLDEKGNLIAVLSTVIDLTFLTDFYQPSQQNEQSILSATDWKGFRLFFYPSKESTNAIGQPINPAAWEKASHAQVPGVFIGQGSDGVRRIYAFKQIRLDSGAVPYMYVWAGVPESYALKSANKHLARNVSLMLFATVLSLFVSWTIGKRAFISPINNLIDMTRKFSGGNFDFRSNLPRQNNEFGTLIKSFYEMSDRLQSSQGALIQSEEKTRLILDSAAEAIYGVDQAGHCTFCNRSCLDLLGYHSERDLLGLNMHSLIHHTSEEGLPNAIENCRIHDPLKLGKQVHVQEEVFCKIDGTFLYVECWSHPILKNGTVVGSVVTFIDISKRKQVEVERESLIKQLQEKTAEQERFIYTVSHDLKSPLVTIGCFCGVVKEDLASGNLEQCKNDLDIISSAASRMEQLLNELLHLSRVGIQRNPREAVSLEDLINEATESISGVTTKHKTTIEVESGLPNVMVDRQLFLQVIENLLANASRYSRSANGGSNVKIGVTRNSGELICHVKDNGMGIDARYLEKIFGLFERLDVNSDSTGVGLAIVKRIVENHGGRIWAESEGLGHGTTFFFTVPEA